MMAEIATLHVEVVELDESDRLCLLRHYPGELDPRPARISTRPRSSSIARKSNATVVTALGGWRPCQKRRLNDE